MASTYQEGYKNYNPRYFCANWFERKLKWGDIAVAEPIFAEAIKMPSFGRLRLFLLSYIAGGVAELLVEALGEVRRTAKAYCVCYLRDRTCILL